MKLTFSSVIAGSFSVLRRIGLPPITARKDRSKANSTSRSSGLVFLFPLVCLSATLATGADSRPNIVAFYTDDHGHADLSCQGILDDTKTPHVDALANTGVLARHGYSTAPQCVPSRAGLLVGKFQSKFGVESNGKSLDGFDHEVTIAE